MLMMMVRWFLGIEFESGCLVYRDLTGPFAQCQTNKEFNTTFMGGYFNNNYDPRFRG